MDVDRRGNDWLVSLTWEERANLYAADKLPSERALAVVAGQAAVDIDELHSAIIRTSGDEGMEIVVRQRKWIRSYNS